MPIKTLNRVVGKLMENKESKLTNRYDSLPNKGLNPRV